MAAATPVTSENPSSDPVPDRSAAPLRVGVLGAHGRLGTAIVAVIGYLWLGEHMSPLKALSLAMIVLGVIRTIVRRRRAPKEDVDG